MFSAKQGLLPAVMACAIGLGVSAARADDASSAQLEQKVDQLQAKVDSLEAAQAQQADMTAAVQAVVADADGRTQMMGSIPSGLTYTSATGLTFTTDDGNFSLHPWMLGQFRGVGNYRDSINSATGGGADAPATGSNSQSGFEIRRLEFGVDGNIYSPNLKYFLQVEANRAGGGVLLDDAYMTYRLSDTSPWTLQAGQFKDIVWHESNLDDAHQLLADTSMVGALIGGEIASSTGGFGSTQERVQGIAATYQVDTLRAEAAFHDGYDSGNTKFFDSTLTAGVLENWGLSGRVEYKVMGDQTAWNEYNQFSALDATSEMLIVGGGMDLTQAGGDDGVLYTVDAQYDNPSGLSLYAAYLGNYISVRHTIPSLAVPLQQGDYDNSGVLVQAGYMFNHQWEGFARYDYTGLSGNFGDSIYGREHAVHEMTLGVNYYLYGQRAKFTLDGTYLPNGSPVDADGLGILKDDGHGEVVGRLQVQLLI